MKNSRYIIFVISTICLISILVISYKLLGVNDNDKDKKNISVIVYGDNIEMWYNLKEGINQAANDYNVDFSFITMSSNTGAAQQTALINREINKGADGIIVAPIDSQKMVNTLDTASNQLPVVLVDNSVNSDAYYDVICADNKAMGRDLALTVNEELDGSENILVITNNTSRQSVKDNLDSFKEYINISKIDYWENDNATQDEIIAKLCTNQYGAVVAFDNVVLKKVAEVISSQGRKEKLYGIGNTNEIVSYLDEGIIDAIVYKNDFNVGYLAVEKVVMKMGDYTKELDNHIEYKVIYDYNMYDKENQRLLFPNVF